MLQDLKDVAIERLRRVLSMRTRRQIALQRVALRRLTAHTRALPNLLVIGGQRCGTSSLYRYLGQHPQVGSSLRKEVEFFTLFHDKGEDWYRAHFPQRAEAVRRDIRILFEATPNYLFDPRCAQRAAEMLPGTRIIALLRNPVDRAFSHHQHNRRLNHEPLSFAEAIEQEAERMAPARALLAADPGLPLPKEIRRYSYIERGYYAEQLRPWLRHFGPERMLVLISEDFYRDPRSAYNQINSFLELPDWVPDTFRNHSYVGHREPVLADPFPQPLRAALFERFEPANRELRELLGRDLQAWYPSSLTSGSA